MDRGADLSDSVPTEVLAAARSLDHLAGFLRVIRVPRADIRAMIERAPAGTDQAMAVDLPAVLDFDSAGWMDGFDRMGALPEAVRRLYAGPNPPGDEHRTAPRATPLAAHDHRAERSSAATESRPDTNGTSAATESRPDTNGTSAATKGHPDTKRALAALGDARAKLIEEAVDSCRAGRLASAIMLVVAQIDGIAADIPPTPGAALPFLIDDARDWDAPGASLDAATLAAHPGSLAVVAQLMRTSRPDTNLTMGLHRHGVMHGRDLGFDIPQNAARVFALLEALIAWATPIADARRSQ